MTSKFSDLHDHPVTPTTDQIYTWEAEVAHTTIDELTHVAIRAAQWGSDHELEACCKIVPGLADTLRSMRRPKPPSLKQKSLDILDRIQKAKDLWSLDELNVIREALEQIDD